MKPFCLTGNMGCGKSIVAQYLNEYDDVLVIDSDSLAKEIITSGKLKEEINDILCVDVFSKDKVDFKHIAEIIFNDTHKKKLFEQLVHPRVWREIHERVQLSPCEINIVELALVYETKTHDMYESIIVASCSREEQLKRLQEKRHMSLADIEARLKHQLPEPELDSRTGFVINTECSLNELKKRVNVLYKQLNNFVTSKNKP